MNIQKISLNTIMPLCVSNRQDDNRALLPKHDITMQAPLQSDMVSFHGKIGRKTLQAMKAAVKAAEKKAEELIEDTGIVTVKELPAEQKIWKINKKDAEGIHSAILKPQGYIKSFIHNLYDDLIYSEKNPKNPILDIHDREKSVESIIEKSATRKWTSVKEILKNMTDLNGVKIVARKKAGKEEIDNILDRLVPMITSGQLELKEIEIKRPEAIKLLPAKDQEKYDYASMSMLKKLVGVQEGVWNTKKTSKENIRKVTFGKPQYTKGNYCALHLLLDLPNKQARVFEAQFMGAYVGAGKDLDDIIFKILDGKHVDKKYTRIKNLIEELKADTTGALDRFMQYRKDALLGLREKEIRETSMGKSIGKNVKLFISAENYKLTPQYDMNKLLGLKTDCDKNAAAKIAQETKKERSAKEVKKEAEVIELRNAGKEQHSPKMMLDLLIEKFSSKKSKDRNRNKLR